MALNEIYPDPKEQQNTIEIPLEAFLALTKAVRDIRAIHSQWHFGPEGVLCAACSHPANVCEIMIDWPCPTLKTLQQFDELETN